MRVAFFQNWRGGTKTSAWFGRILSMHSYRLKKKKKNPGVHPQGEKMSLPTLLTAHFHHPPPHLPSLLDLIWPRDLDSPGPRLSHRVPPLPQRIGPITPQPQPDQSSLPSRERSSKKALWWTPPLLHPPPSLPPPPFRQRTGPDEKTWIAGPWHSAPLSDRPLIPRLSCSHPISSVY